MAEQRAEWADWLREQFDRHPSVRINADLSRAGGLKANGRPLIDPSTITQWLRGRRPSYALAVAAAEAFGVDVDEALVAAGYVVTRTPRADGFDITVTDAVGPDDHDVASRPVGLGLDEEAGDLLPEQINAIRALIRSMKPQGTAE